MISQIIKYLARKQLADKDREIELLKANINDLIKSLSNSDLIIQTCNKDKLEIIKEKELEILSLIKERNTLKLEIESLKNKDTDLEKFCKSKFMQIDNIAYKNKRKMKGLSYSVYLNEMIIPSAFEVKKLLFKINPTGDLYKRAYEIGDEIAKSFTWTDDKNLDTSGDYYLYPSEFISLKLGDCEDHSFLVSSMEPEIGIGYGFYIDGAREFGHAFNVFLFDNKLYILETTGDEVFIMEYKENDKYRIHYLITKNYTFQLKGGVNFGEIAGY